MNSRLEQWVRDHREEFDSEEPDNKVWEKISADMSPDKKKRGALVRFNPARWSAAAAVVLVMAGAGWYFSTRSHTSSSQAPVVASSAKPDAGTSGSNSGAKPSPTTQTESENHAGDSQLATIRPAAPAGAAAEIDNSMDEEMYHYARLVEIKHNQLKAIEKDEPLLYKQFASDVSKLDSVYHNLQSQLPKNPNREQLLEAMLQNLQLQMGLLNHQLDIIKQINHSKKTEYEKAYKTA